MKLLFVYNAEDGIFNAMADSLHKVFSPATYECQLCKLTYGLVSMHGAWRDYLENLPYPFTFLYRKAFLDQHIASDEPLPLILMENDGSYEVLMTAETLKGCGTLEALMDKLTQAREAYAAKLKAAASPQE